LLSGKNTYGIGLHTFEKFTMIPQTVPSIILIQSALNIRIANLKKEQQSKFLKDFCYSNLRSVTNLSRECKSKEDCLLSSLSHYLLKTECFSFAGQLCSVLFSPEIPTWIRNCGNESHPYSLFDYFLDDMEVYTELPISTKPSVYFKSTHISYMVDSESFDFLTCNSIEHKIVYTIFAQYFDLYVWLSLVFSIVSITALIRLKQKSHWGDLVLNFIGILLNISTYIGKVFASKKWSFVHWVLFIWFFGAFVPNNWYQIVVISDFIKPAAVISPWNHIFALHEFSVVTPLGESFPSLESLRNLTNFQDRGKVRFIYEKSFMKKKVPVVKGTILYESAKNQSSAVLAWGYTAFGHRMWSMFDM